MKLKLVLGLADTIRWARQNGHPFAPEHIELLADFCARHHQGFNRQKWLDYVAWDQGSPPDDDLATHMRQVTADRIRQLGDMPEVE